MGVVPVHVVTVRVILARRARMRAGLQPALDLGPFGGRVVYASAQENERVDRAAHDVVHLSARIEPP